jgi:hypothetical protein
MVRFKEDLVADKKESEGFSISFASLSQTDADKALSSIFSFLCLVWEFFAARLGPFIGPLWEKGQNPLCFCVLLGV